MATAPFLDKDGATVNIELPLTPGRAAAAASRPVALSNEDAAYLDGIETLLTAIDGRVDGLETLVGTTNSTLTTIDGRVDGLETLITSTNTKLDTAIASLAIIDNMVLSAGTAHIGEVAVEATQLADALSAYAAIATSPAQQVALPTDHPTQAVAQDTSRILNGASGVSLTPKWAAIAASTSGDNEIVAAVTGKKIRVLFWDFAPNAAVNAKWRSATTDKTGLYYMANQGNGHARNFNPVGWFETASGAALNLNLSGAVAVGGIVGYVEV